MLNVRFYKTPTGNEIVLDFVRNLPERDRKVLGEDLLALQLGYPMGPPLCKPIRNGLWELRSSLPSGNEARLIYFFHSSSRFLIVVNAFIKKTPRIPPAEIELAERRKGEYG